MNFQYPPDQLEAFRLTAEVVRREARHMKQTHCRLFAVEIDEAWVSSLETNLDLAERLEAFVSRFGRLQDTLGEKLLPRMMVLAGSRTLAMIEMLVSAEKLGWIESVDQWIEWRKLRNRLVHEYMRDQSEFVLAVRDADKAAIGLLNAEMLIRSHAARLSFL